MRKLTSIALHSFLAVAASAVCCTAIADNVTESGADTYKLVCSSCHEVGIEGAPILDDKVAWMHRIDQGTNSLYASTLNGKCKVLVQANRKDLSDQTIKDAVDYIISQVKQ